MQQTYNVKLTTVAGKTYNFQWSPLYSQSYKGDVYELFFNSPLIEVKEEEGKSCTIVPKFSIAEVTFTKVKKPMDKSDL